MGKVFTIILHALCLSCFHPLLYSFLFLQCILLCFDHFLMYIQITTLFPANGEDHQSCSRLLAQLNLQSLMVDSRKTTYSLIQDSHQKSYSLYSLNPSCSLASSWSATWAESAYCREIAQEFGFESSRPCSS